MGRKIKNDTKIADDFTCGNWKKLRERLSNNFGDQKVWFSAFEIFEKRVNTRFIDPINNILDVKLNKGEGFAIVALQCILMEFFEAFYQGKIYSTPRSEEEIQRKAKKYKINKSDLNKHLQPNEYNSSSKLFKDFLKNHKPFSESFGKSKYRNGFYSKIRCGLLHEAATKGSYVINIEGNKLIEEVNGEIIINRTILQKDLNKYLENYKNELILSDKLKKAFIRKMDDLCQMKRVYYFAYGSNLKYDIINKRTGFTDNFYDYHPGYLKGYELVFNKRSYDGTSKANIIKNKEGSKVWGICYELCYELDEKDFEKLKEDEKGYKDEEVIVYENDNKFIIAKTFISKDISNDFPSKEYVNLIIEGAKEKQLPEEYIQHIIKISNIKNL